MDGIDFEQLASSGSPGYFATPPIKFVALSLCAFGMYEIYWSYKSWRFAKSRDGTEIMPFWRAVFYPLWHYSLLTELNKTLDSEALSRGAYRVFLAASVLVLSVL